MKLQASDGSFFELIIVSYQFPDLPHADYDSNWLLIKIDVRHPRGSWSTIDPSLLTYEVESLAEWFEKVRKGEKVETDIDFVEPNLSFQLYSDLQGNYLRVYFELESRPSWATSDAAGMRDLWIQFPLADLNLLDVAASLRHQLALYPQRTFQ